MDPTPFITLGLKAVPVVVDNYPHLLGSRGIRRSSNSVRDRDRRVDVKYEKAESRGYDSSPGGRSGRERRRSTNTRDEYKHRDMNASGRTRDDGRDNRRSGVAGGDVISDVDRRGTRRSDIVRDQDRHSDRHHDRDYYNSDAGSPSPSLYSRRPRKSSTFPIVAGAVTGRTLASGTSLADSDTITTATAESPISHGTSRDLTRYRSPSTANTQITPYKSSLPRRSKSQSGTRDYKRNVSPSPSTSSSSSSSSASTKVSVSAKDDKKRAHKLKYSVPLTAGIAAVATVHALSGVYKSVKAHDERILQVHKGEMTEKESKRIERKGHLHDAAKLGLSVMAIEAATSKWKEVMDERHEYKQHKVEKSQRDRKRGEIAKKMEKERRERHRERRDDSAHSHRDRDGRDRKNEGRRDRDGQNRRGDRLARRSEPDLRRHRSR